MVMIDMEGSEGKPDTGTQLLSFSCPWCKDNSEIPDVCVLLTSPRNQPSIKTVEI